jgi:hypothetical protein
MQLRAFNEEQAKKTEQPIFLRLIDDPMNNEVSLYACEENGDLISGGCLIRIRPCGLFRYKDVSESIGFPLDYAGRIVLYEGEKE